MRVMKLINVELFPFMKLSRNHETPPHPVSSPISARERERDRERERERDRERERECSFGKV